MAVTKPDTLSGSPALERQHEFALRLEMRADRIDPAARRAALDAAAAVLAAAGYSVSEVVEGCVRREASAASGIALQGAVREAAAAFSIARLAAASALGVSHPNLDFDLRLRPHTLQ